MKSKIVVVLMIACLMAGTLIQTKEGKAASCNIILSMEEDEVAVGNAFVMSVSIEAEEVISGVEMMLQYDEDYLEYVTASPAVSGGEGSLKISDLDMASNSTSICYVVKFEVKKAGVSYVKVNSNASIYNESSGQTMSTASNVLAVSGDAQNDASSENHLYSLKISGGVMEPEFSQDVLEYNVTVESGITRLIISAQPVDAAATVQVLGDEFVQPGENEITIIVTAENGDTLQYNLTAIAEEETNKEETKPNEETNQQQTEESGDLEVFEPEAITAVKNGSQVLLTTYGTFMIEELTDSSILPKGYTKTTLLIDGCAITVYEQSTKKSDFVLLYASRDGKDPALYQYDKSENTIQRFNQSLLVEDAVDVISENLATSDSSRPSIVYDTLMIVLAALSILFMGTTVFFYRKSKSKRRSKRRH